MKDISIIIPIYNAEDTIERVLASLISNKNFIKEVILVNDRTTDTTFDKIEIFKSFFDLKVIDNQGEKGPGPARKTGILAATSKWITFIDADDCLTPNSLCYINQILETEPHLILLHTKTIYYEIGSFNQEHIEFSDNSCGGNFYNREYLIKNNLFPHDTLYMSEDEYFNEIITTYIRYVDLENEDDLIRYYDYPVYEVHHDANNVSLAHSNWKEYIYTYHLLYKKYVLEYFNNTNPFVCMKIKLGYMHGLIFSYFVIQSLIQDSNIEFIKEDLKIFYDNIEFGKKILNMTDKELIQYYRKNPFIVNSIKEGVINSTGSELKELFSFSDLIYKRKNISFNK